MSSFVGKHAKQTARIRELENSCRVLAQNERALGELLALVVMQTGMQLEGDGQVEVRVVIDAAAVAKMERFSWQLTRDKTIDGKFVVRAVRSEIAEATTGDAS